MNMTMQRPIWLWRQLPFYRTPQGVLVPGDITVPLAQMPVYDTFHRTPLNPSS